MCMYIFIIHFQDKSTNLCYTFTTFISPLLKINHGKSKTAETLVIRNIPKKVRTPFVWVRDNDATWLHTYV